jgi:transcriptional regulator with XRE-family HTH domain
MPQPDDAELPPLERFAAVLKHWRDNRKLSQAGLARIVLVHRDLIAKIENCRRWPTHDLVLRCEATLAAGGELARLWPEIETERARLQLLAAHDRLSVKLQTAAHLGLPGPLRQRMRPAPESALLGIESVTIVTPLKQEAIKSRPVVALEDVVGAQRLGDLALRLGLTPRFETIPIGGEIDLDRPNLLVICGPRISPQVAALLERDAHLRFVNAPDGPWTLHDNNTGKTYRSGQDQRPPKSRDVAYLARLARPDRKGSLLIFTGIHPQGSLGVVSLIVEQIQELHAEAGNRDFSVLVGTDYHADTGEPLRVHRMTPLYWQEEQRSCV